MSVRCINQVLDASSHAGTELLMLVVLADYSDDDGNSYPAVASLARKCRMTPRNANYILTALQASGELRVLKNEGPKGTNRYRIMLAALGQRPLKLASPLKSASPLKPASATPEAGFLKPLKPASDEPSLNRQEPSPKSAGADRTAAARACPYQQIVDRFHAALPDLPRALVLDAKNRKRDLATFWAWVLSSTKSDGNRRATNSEEALAWISSFFERAKSNDFLMGRTTRAAEHQGWKCTLDYLVSERGRLQVIERTEVAA